MGFGRCRLQSTVTQNQSNVPRKHKPRPHCDSFYWDISSVLIKTACLATFFVAESPRRILSYVTRKPEPKPYFLCSRWGYRMCACGHHYYEHEDVSESEKFFSTSAASRDAASKPSDSSATTNGTPAPGAAQKGTDGIPIKGSSFKDIIQKITEQAVANQATESPPDSSTDSSTTSTPPETPKKKKRRRRWYWPF